MYVAYRTLFFLDPADFFDGFSPGLLITAFLFVSLVVVVVVVVVVFSLSTCIVFIIISESVQM